MSNLRGRISAAGTRLSTSRRTSKGRFSFRRGNTKKSGEIESGDEQSHESEEEQSQESEEPEHLFGTSTVSNTIVTVFVDNASNLTAADKNGHSDPYVEVSIDGFARAKSKVIKKTLNPHWREELSLVCATSFRALKESNATLDLRVYDWDRFGKNDFLGIARIDLAEFRRGHPMNITASLIHDPTGEKGGTDVLHLQAGTIQVTVTVSEEFALDDRGGNNAANGGSRVERKKGGIVPSYLQNRVGALLDNIPTRTPRRGSRAGSLIDASHSAGRARQLLVVDVVAARELPTSGQGDGLNPMVKVKVGKQNQKTKVGKRRVSAVQAREWKESFEFLLKPENDAIELTVVNKGLIANTFLGMVNIDLRRVSMDHTTNAWYELLPDKRGQGGGGEIHLLITLTDLEADTKLRDDVRERYCGVVRLHIARARDLAAKDLGGSSDPYCMVQLGNSRQRTATKHRTVNPEWNKTIEMGVKDVFDTIRLTIYDEDKGKDEFLGALVIPLLEIENNRMAWYRLKEEDKAKIGVGEVQLRLHLDYNLAKSLHKLVSRREEHVMVKKGKFDLAKLKNNRLRLMKLVTYLMNKARQVNNLFNWEYDDSVTWPAVVIFVIACVFMRVWHVPIIILLVLLYENPDTASLMNRAVPSTSISSLTPEELAEIEEEIDSEPEEEVTNNNKSRGLYAKYKEVSRAGYRAQSGMDTVASFAERVKNTFNWSVPLATWAVCGICLCMGIAMYLVPFNYLLLGGGLRKFGKSFLLKKGYRRRPKYYKPYNPLFAALGRIPSDVDRLERTNYIVEDEDV